MVNYIIELSIDERMNMVYELLELLKANKLNDIQKKQIYEIVNKLPDRTEKQKERFFRFYNLLDGEKKDYRLCVIYLRLFPLMGVLYNLFHSSVPRKVPGYKMFYGAYKK